MADSGSTTPKRFSPFLRQLYVVSGLVQNTISTGCIIGYPAVLLPQLRLPTSGIPVDPDSESWIASIVGFAILNGILAVPFLMNRCGRRLTNLISIIPGLAGWGFIFIADSVPVLILARYLQGFTMGMQGPMTPISIGEYTSPVNRGGFLGSIAFSLATGMLFCHTCGCFLSWKYTALASMSFSVVAFVVIFTSPETPACLAFKGKFDKCRETFFWLRGNSKKDCEEVEILISKQLKERNMTRKKSKEKCGKRLKNLLGILKKKEFYMPSAIMLMMFTLMQFSGANVIPTYSVTIMKAVTGDSVSPYTGMLVVDVVRFIAAVISCFTLRRFTVRSVLFSSSIVSTIAVIFTGIYLCLKDLGYISITHSWIPITSMLIYIYAMTSGIYAVPFAVLGEVFPLAYKSLGSVFSGMVLSTTFFAAIKLSPYLFIHIGVHGAFFVFGIFITVTTTILYFILPETSGKTLQQIEDSFKGIGKKVIELKTPEEDKMLKHNSDIEIT